MFIETKNGSGIMQQHIRVQYINPPLIGILQKTQIGKIFIHMNFLFNLFVGDA
jgi:hypothetical protein